MMLIEAKILALHVRPRGTLVSLCPKACFLPQRHAVLDSKTATPSPATVQGIEYW